MKIVILNGPNLNLLGRREPSIYGNKSMEQVLVDIQRAYPDVHFEYRQSNHEGDLIDWVQGYGLEDASLQFSGRPKGYGLEDACQEAVVCRSATPVDRPSGCSKEVKGIVLNAGGYTHTSVALRDAVACSKIPVVEVHISDITQREEFRRVSLLTDVCAHTIMGHGTDGYKESIEWILGESRA